MQRPPEADAVDVTAAVDADLDDELLVDFVGDGPTFAIGSFLVALRVRDRGREVAVGATS